MIYGNNNSITATNIGFNNSSIRIAHFVESLAIGGVERGLSTILEKFAKKDLYMILLTLTKSKIEYDLFPKIKRFYLKKIDVYEIDLNYLTQLVITNKINIFIHHWITNENYIPEILNIIHSLGIKIIYFTHNTFLNRSFRYKNIILESKDYDLFISLVNFNSLYYSSIKNRNSILVHNLMNFNVGKKLPDYYSNKNILIIGRAMPVKNYEFIIDVFIEVLAKIKDAKLQIVGLLRKQKRQEYIKFILKKIKKSGLENDVIVTGATLDINSFYKNSSIYISCSHYEGFPNVVSEAKSYGLATIVVGVTYITPANNGTINIHEYDKKKVKNVIINLLTNNTYLQEMRQFSFSNRFEITNKVIVDKWIQIYKNLLSNKIHEMNALKLNSNDYSMKRYLELDNMMNRELINFSGRSNIYNYMNDLSMIYFI